MKKWQGSALEVNIPKKSTVANTTHIKILMSIIIMKCKLKPQWPIIYSLGCSITNDKK